MRRLARRLRKLWDRATFPRWERRNTSTVIAAVSEVLERSIIRVDGEWMMLSAPYSGDGARDQLACDIAEEVMDALWRNGVATAQAELAAAVRKAGGLS